MPASGMGTHRVVDLRCEYAINPLGLGSARPRLSWRLETDRRNARQSAYQVVVAGEEHLLDSASLLWDSGVVQGAATAQLEYAGPALVSGRRYLWRVRSWDEQGSVSEWSEPAWWEMGLLESADWRAEWISPLFDGEVGSETPPVSYLRREFAVSSPVRAARLYVTSLGLNEVHLNGQRVGDYLLTPGWTSYHKRLLVATYDVTALIRTGQNVLGALLAEGWYRGRIGAVGGRRCAYGTRLALLAQLQITHADGSLTVTGSDGQWRAATGPILSSGIYDGEVHDARRELPGWCAPGYDDSAWDGVESLDARTNHLEPAPGPWVRRMQEIRPRADYAAGAYTRIYDLGQNMTGWVRLRVRGVRGMRLVVRHAEVLEADGTLHTKNLRSARQTDTWILAGDEVVDLEPRFTFHGFRYVEISSESGWPAALEVTGVVLHSDLETSGSFRCSDERLNRLQQNIVWGQRGNFVDVPTDCPQRDERLGWSGDAQVFAPTACFNMNSALFFTKWLRDLLADQHPGGAFPIAAPLPCTVIEELSPSPGIMLPFRVQPGYGAAGYADAAVIVPWTLYTVYGDTRILGDCYAGMVRWVEGVLAGIDDDLIVDGWFQFGDWLAPFAPTIPDLAATAYFAWSVHLLGRIAGLVGKGADAPRFAGLFDAIRQAFCARFVRQDGRMEPESQSAYVLALAFDLLPAALRAPAAQFLVADIRARGNHLATGFLGTPHLCRVLVEAGYLDVAYDLLLQESYPSWLYPLAHGATTIWERWNGIEPDGTLFHPAMNSFNHYAYGAIGEFLYSTVAGLERAPGSAGFGRLLIRPRPGGGITFARLARMTQHGQIALAWSVRDGRFLLDLTLPPNTSALLCLPTCDDAGQALEGGSPLAAAGFFTSRSAADALQVEIGAGSYQFDVAYVPPASLPSPAPALDFRYPRHSVFSSAGALLDAQETLAVITHTVADSETLVAVMSRRRMYSLHQLQMFLPELLTPATLDRLDVALRQLN